MGLSLAYSELPLLLVEKHALQERLHERGGEKEVRFLWRARPTLLPVWWNGKLHVVRWGNKERQETKIPPTGWTWEETVESGWWSQLAPEEVVVPASFGFTNGVWFKVTQGMRGLLVHDRGGVPVVFLLCRPATRYYEIMCRAAWMRPRSSGGRRGGGTGTAGRPRVTRSAGRRRPDEEDRENLRCSTRRHW